MTPVDNRVKRIVVRRLNSSPSLSSKPGIPTGSNTKWGGNYHEVSLMTHHQSEPQPSNENKIIHGQKFPDDSNRGQDFANYTAHSQGSATRENSQLVPSVIIHKSSQNGASRPFYQSLHPSPADNHKDARKSHSGEKKQRKGSQRVNGGETFWQLAKSVLFSTRGSGQSVAALQARHSRLREINKFNVVGLGGTHSKTETNKFFSPVSRSSTLKPLVSNGLQSFEFKRNLSPETQESSITDSTQWHSGSSNKKTRLLFNSTGLVSETIKGVTADRVGAALRQRLPEANIHSQISSKGEEVHGGVLNPRRFKPGKLHNVKTRVHHANLARQGESVNNHAKHSYHGVQTNLSGILPPKESVASGWVNLATVEVAQIAGFKGLVKRIWRPANRFLNLSSSHVGGRNKFRNSILEKKTLQVTNVYHPSLTPQHSFSHKTTTPHNDLITSPASLDGEDDEMKPSLFDHDVKRKKNRGRQFQSHSRSYGLKGFSSWPHEGATGFIKSPYKSVRDQGGSVLGELKGERSESTQLESRRIDRWQNKTGSGSETVKNHEDLKKEGIKSFVNLRLQPDHHKSGNAHDTRGKQSKTTALVEHSNSSSSSSFSSSSSTPAAKLNSWSASLPRTVVGFYKPRPSIGVAKGQRLRGKATTKPSNYFFPQNVVIIRKPVPRLQVFTYTDILGSASFTGIRFTNRTTATSDTEDSSFPTAAEEKMENGDKEIGEESAKEKEKEVELVKVGEGNKYSDQEDEDEGKELEDVGERRKEDMEEKDEKAVNVKRLEDKEKKKDEEEVEYVERSAKEAEKEEVEAGEQSIDFEVAICGGNYTSRSLETNSGSDGHPQDANSVVSMSQLDSKGSGGGCLNTTDVPSPPTSEPQQGVSGSAVPESIHQEELIPVHEEVPHKT